MNINNRDICGLCFAPCDKGADICRDCRSHDIKTYHNTLKPETVLAGKYIVGKVLGRGGFGITYLGYDITKNMKIAIKEYMPSNFAYRSDSDKTVRSYNNEKKEQFDEGCRKFYEEAKLVSKFNHFENIIHVYEFFFENNTAYFVMEYLDGTDLKTYINRRGGKISEKEALEILIKMTDILKEVHKKDIIHRDISPDNIFMCKNGCIKLIDFGASRQFCDNHNKSMSIILKPSFAPVEQYQRHGKQGPGTDIYALGATVYYAISGQMVPDALSRISEDTLDLSFVSPQMKIILSGMLAVMAQKRYPDIESLRNDLMSMKKYLSHSYDNANPIPSSGNDANQTPDLFCRNCATPLVNGKCPKCTADLPKIKTGNMHSVSSYSLKEGPDLFCRNCATPLVNGNCPKCMADLPKIKTGNMHSVSSYSLKEGPDLFCRNCAAPLVNGKCPRCSNYIIQKNN